MKITGYYDEFGYQVETDNPYESVIYRAGNHALDSQQDGTGTPYQLRLEVIREYCEQTAKAMADEKNVEFTGIEYSGIEYLE